MNRAKLITQLRHALSLATSPKTEVAEFEIGDTDFCFEFDTQSDCGCKELGSECPACEVEQ